MGTPVKQLFDLSGQVALVTGGSRGLGLQMAESLGDAGARIMLTSRKATLALEATPTLVAVGAPLASPTVTVAIVSCPVAGSYWL